MTRRHTRPRPFRASAISFTTSPEDVLMKPSHRKNDGRSVVTVILPRSTPHDNLSPASRSSASRTSLGTVVWPLLVNVEIAMVTLLTKGQLCKDHKFRFLLRGRDLVLLDFPVGHDERRQSQRLRRKLDAISAERHAAAERLAGLDELLRRAERRQARGEILDRLVAEVGVRIRRELRAVDASFLQLLENLAHLVCRFGSCWIGRREDRLRDRAGDLFGRPGRVHV